ncbi:hypothetical protein VTN00DRAFT_6266 [Thermoascus crustaceus]|uniref:uncharacterized protein n=1 Tax=Thermoascus crustaceus TaxID=5088 RepID=UPI003742E0D6
MENSQSSHISGNPSPSTVSHNHKPKPEENVHEFIDNALASMLGELSKPDGRPSITLKQRSKRECYSINPSSGALEAAGQDVHTTYSWPGKNVHEAWKFTITIRVLGLIAEAIRGDFVTSKRYKRDIYYNDPVYFGSQRVVDTLVDDIAYTIGVDRAALHVLMSTDQSDQDFLIPRLEDIEEVDLSEAVFRRLANTCYHTTSAAGKGILITGKGYPDLCTRAFVRLLSDTKSESPSSNTPSLYALVDSDPDGMAIMATYKYGSMAQAHENAKLNAPSLRWLGLHTSDVAAGIDPQGEDALIPLSARDRKKALAMLSGNPIFAEDGPEPGWRAKLQQMLMLNMKAEIEILYGMEGGINAWIDQKLRGLT